MATETVPDKPLLRGWLHLGMSVLVVLGVTCSCWHLG